ncbi:MAG: protein kinase [Phycisphaeraceae bacterium]
MPTFVEKVASVVCSQCSRSVSVVGEQPLDTIDCPHCGGPIIVPGKVGSLTLRKVLGRGEAGIVYEAFDEELQKPVAVKVFFRKQGTDVTAHVEKCLAEARAMRALHHTNVVEIFRVAQKGERPFIVMELLTGDRLDKVIAESWLIEEPRALRMAIDIASGLKAVHDGGFVHLDVKPANIQMAGDGTCKLLDYDQALSLRQIEEKGGAGLVGTPYYVAPEIIKHEPVDFRADMFSMGATLFHLIAQRPPFQGDDSREVVQQRLKRKAMDLRQIRADVSPLTAATINRMLEPDPSDRYPTYDALLTDLRAASAQAVRQVLAAQAKQAQAASPMNRVAILAVVSLVLVAGLIFALTRGGGETPVEPPPRGGTHTPVPSGLTKDSMLRDGGTKDALATGTGTKRDGFTKDGSDTLVDPSKITHPVSPVKIKSIDDIDPVRPLPSDPTKDSKTVIDPPKVDPVKPPVEVVDVEPREVASAGGWTGTGETKLMWKPKLLTVWGLSPKPQIVLKDVKLPVAAGDSSIVEIRLKAGGAGKGRLSWRTAGDADFVESNGREIELKHDNAMHDYLVPLSAAGEIISLRIELGDDPGIFEMESIRFFAKSADKQPAKVWGFEKP